MQYRNLGGSEIPASIVGLGTYLAGSGNNDGEYITAINKALDRGVTLIDTAPSYGWGHGEKVVGKAIKGRRDDVVIATKCGLWWHDERGSPIGEKDGKDVRLSLRPDTIRIEVEDSLRRLDIETIDLLQCHKPAVEPELTPIEETMDCLAALKEEGKVRAIGISNVSIEQLDRYRVAGELASHQFRYSMLFRAPEDDVLPYCAEHNVASICYLSLEQGLLTGKVGPDRIFNAGDWRANAEQWLPWFRRENRQKLLDMFAGWQDLLEHHNCTIAQLVIAWTAAQPGATHILCGLRTADQGIEAAGAAAILLSQSDVQRIRSDLTALGNPVTEERGG